MSRHTCCELIVEYLISQGVPYVAGIFGHGNLPFSMALNKNNHRIKFIMVKHEQAAVHLADGYARATGKPMAVTTSLGPGAFNTIMGIATAYIDGIPLLVFTGQGQTYMWGRGTFQGLERNQMADFPSVTRPITKASFQVTHIEQLPTVLKTAFRMATGGRPGPVHIDLPMDIQAASLEAEIPNPSTYMVEGRPGADPAAVDRAARALVQAKKPVILAGGGVIASNASSELIGLAEYLGIPVLTSFSGKGSIPEDHELCAYYTGFKGSTCGCKIALEADLFLALGYRFSEWSTSSYTPGVSFRIPPAKIVQVDIDENVIGLNYPVELGIQGDVKVVLGQVLQRIKELAGPRDYRDSHSFQELQRLREEWRVTRAKIAAESHPMRTAQLLQHLRSFMPRNGIVVGAVGYSQMQIYQEFPLYEPRTYISSAGFAPMGFAISAAMGAKLALPEKMVVAVMGDGDFLMNCQELATAMQYHIPVIYVIDDNTGHLSIRDLQLHHGGGEHFGTEYTDGVTEDLYRPDLMQIARGFGVPSFHVREVEELVPALQKASEVAVDSRSPVVVDVVTNRSPDERGSPNFGLADTPVPQPDGKEWLAPWVSSQARQQKS